MTEQTSLKLFESHLEQLETAVRSGTPLSELCGSALETICTLESTTQVQLWSGQRNRFEVLAVAGISADTVPFASTSVYDAVIRCAAAGRSELIRDPECAASGTARHLLFLPQTLSDRHVAVLVLTLDSAPADERLLTDAGKALVDCLSLAVSRELLNQLDERIAVEAALSQLVRRLAGCRTTEECALAIVDDGVELLGGGRVSVLEKRGERWKIVAITSAGADPPASDATRRLITLAALAFPNQPPRKEIAGRWIPLSPAPANGGPDGDGEWSRTLEEFRRSGTVSLRIAPLAETVAQPELIAVLEFYGSLLASPKSPASAVGETGMPLESLLNRALAEFAVAWQRCRTQSTTAARSFPGSPRSRMTMAGIGLILSLWLIPAELKLTVSGQMFPTIRQRVFAPDNGVITELLVAEDETVAAGQPLLRLHNAELELESGRLSGEIDAAVARLQSIRAARNAGLESSGTSPGAARSSIDLSSEEQLTQHRLISLQAEQKLVTEQLQSLLVAAPIDGIVYQQNLDQHLRTRPVERGQELLEIVGAAGEWDLLLSIPDEITGYVRSQMKASDSAGRSPQIRFTLSADPRTVYVTKIRDLDRSSHIEEGRVRCRATAAIGDLPTERRRAGAAVSAQIYCGRRSLGFVWFREIIEFARRKWQFGL